MRAARATTARVATLALAVARLRRMQHTGTAAPPAPPRIHRSPRASEHRAVDQRTGAHTPDRPAPRPRRPPVPAVLTFRATTVDGTAFAGAELAGKKTVLWFWAPWCTVCARAAAGVKDAAAALGPDVRVVGRRRAQHRRRRHAPLRRPRRAAVDDQPRRHHRRPLRPVRDHPAGHLRARRRRTGRSAGTPPTARTSTSSPSPGRPSAERPWTPHPSCSPSAPAPSPR